uniref:rRNA biogenesis protein RRP36 n=1 Tax=Anopheles aquasalis TaxID=42839 RepID=T1DP49_ANOAQ
MDSSDDQSEQEQSQSEEDSVVDEDSSAEDEDEEDEEEDDVPKLADKEFKEIPFEDLLKLQQKLGTRVYNEAIFGKVASKPKPVDAEKDTKKRKPELEKTDSESDDDDSGPEEISSRRKMPTFAKVRRGNNDESTEQRPRDPRFDPKQGYFSGRKFRQDYGFINDLRSKELKIAKPTELCGGSGRGRKD